VEPAFAGRQAEKNQGLVPNRPSALISVRQACRTWFYVQRLYLTFLLIAEGCSLPTGRQAPPKGAPLGPALGPLAPLFFDWKPDRTTTETCS